MKNVQFRAKFVAGVVTHRGELAGELIDLIQNCAGRLILYKQRDLENIDGDTQAAARFRSGFKKDIYIALGWAGQLVAVRTRPFRIRYDAAGGSGGVR